MSGGGAGGGSTVAPTYVDPVNGMSFADGSALNAEIAQRQAGEKVTSDAATAKDAQDKLEAKSKFQERFAAAKTGAATNANQYFTDNGYDPKMFATQLANSINTSSQNVQDLAPNPNAAFSPNLGASILAGANAGVQTKASNAVGSLFSPTYAQDNVSNSWLSPAVDSVLTSQFNPLADGLSNALKRGTLNDQGYQAALAAMGRDRTTATSTVNNLGRNILANDRTGVNNYITQAKNDAGNVNVSNYDAFDPSHYASGASDLVSGYQGNFGGDLSNAIGKTSFSDLSSLINAGGVSQGATDPTATNPTAGGAPGAGSGSGVSEAYIAQQALAKQPRGIGSQGAF